MNPTLGTQLHYTPDNTGWEAKLRDKENALSMHPIIGWAVVVTYIDPNATEFETAIQPVILWENRNPTPLHELLRVAATADGERYELVELVRPAAGERA